MGNGKDEEQNAELVSGVRICFPGEKEGELARARACVRVIYLFDR